MSASSPPVTPARKSAREHTRADSFPPTPPAPAPPQVVDAPRLRDAVRVPDAPEPVISPVPDPENVKRFVGRVSGTAAPFHGPGWTSTPAESLKAALKVIEGRPDDIRQASNAAHQATVDAMRDALADVQDRVNAIKIDGDEKLIGYKAKCQKVMDAFGESARQLFQQVVDERDELAREIDEQRGIHEQNAEIAKALKQKVDEQREEIDRLNDLLQEQQYLMVSAFRTKEMKALLAHFRPDQALSTAASEPGRSPSVASQGEPSPGREGRPQEELEFVPDDEFESNTVSEA